METKKIATKKQEKKVALIGMIIQDADAAEKVNEIYKNCFKDSKIKNVIIEEGIEVIKDYAFSNCMYLENIELASTITYLGKFAFYYCYNLNKINILYKSYNS